MIERRSSMSGSAKSLPGSAKSLSRSAKSFARVWKVDRKPTKKPSKHLLFLERVAPLLILQLGFFGLLAT